MRSQQVSSSDYMATKKIEKTNRLALKVVYLNPGDSRRIRQVVQSTTLPRNEYRPYVSRTSGPSNAANRETQGHCLPTTKPDISHDEKVGNWSWEANP